MAVLSGSFFPSFWGVQKPGDCWSVFTAPVTVTGLAPYVSSTHTFPMKKKNKSCHTCLWLSYLCLFWMWLSSVPSKGRSGDESWEVSFCPRREVITEELIAMFPETAPWEGNRNNATLTRELSNKSSCLTLVTVRFYSWGFQLWLVNPSSLALSTTSLSLIQAQWLELSLICFYQW